MRRECKALRTKGRHPTKNCRSPWHRAFCAGAFLLLGACAFAEENLLPLLGIGEPAADAQEEAGTVAGTEPAQPQEAEPAGDPGAQAEGRMAATEATAAEATPSRRAPAAPAGSVGPAASGGPAASVGSAVSGGPAALGGLARPLVLIRFDRPDVDYEAALSQAVKIALARRPEARFDLVGVQPSLGAVGPTTLSGGDSRRNMERVLRSLAAIGLSVERISLSATTSATARTSEVHLYVR